MTEGNEIQMIKRYVLNLGKLGVPADVIARALEIDNIAVDKWLSYEGIDPGKREKEIRKRQADGIAAAKAKGVRFGRPKVAEPENFGNIVKAWEDKKISATDAMEICGMKEATFYRHVREYRVNQQSH